MATDTSNITFSVDQQLAVLAASITDSKFYDNLNEMGVNKDWFTENRIQDLWTILEEFRKKHKRTPSSAIELCSFAENKGLEKPYIKAFREDMVRALDAKNGLGRDILDQKLIDWAKARKIKTFGLEIMELYNKGCNVPEIEAKLERIGTELARLTLLSGTQVDELLPSNVRVRKEAEVREEQGHRILNYGIAHLDEALGGIIPNELILVGAGPGIGKTELVKCIAEYNAKRQKRVVFFALEAEEHEIERRIKYGYIVKRYKEEHPGYPKGSLSYALWRQNKCNGLDAYKAEAEAYFDQNLSTLRTYYRTRSDFTVESLKREILRSAKDTDLFILDHLHYVDLESDNENSEMSKLTKALRDLVLLTNVPVIAVAHLKKEGSERKLLPELKDFHGTSNLQKIATTAIMLGRAHGIISTSPEGQGTPTYFRIAKCRLEGDRMYNVAVNFYDKNNGGYHDKYAIGHLNFGETKWIALKDGKPFWAKSATVDDISNGGE